MGSVDATCAVTHLPIQYREPCRFLFLRQTLGWQDDDQPGSFEHSWARWLPVGLPIQGLYDGYGRVMAGWHEKIPEGHDSHHALYEPDPVLKFQIESLARVAEPLGVEELQIQGRPSFRGWPNTIESLMAACERGWLRLRLPRSTDAEDGKYEIVRVSPYLVSERAWQAVIAPTAKQGIGVTRGRPERHDTDPVGSLRNAIEYHRDQEARDERLAKIVEHGDEETRRLFRETQELLGKGLGIGLRDLGPHFENMPDMLVTGGNWNPDLQERKSLFEFQDEDWKKLTDLTFDMRVFFFTMRDELRRELHPELYTDQFYFPEQRLDAHRVLVRYIEQWCIDEETKAEKEEAEDAD